MITPTGEKDHAVDEDDSVASDILSDMGEECDLRAPTMPDISLSERVAVLQETLRRKGTGTAQPHIGVCVRVRPV